jgi:hypothetical protein
MEGFRKPAVSRRRILCRRQAVIVKRSATVLKKKEDDPNTASLDGLRPYRTAGKGR